MMEPMHAIFITYCTCLSAIICTAMVVSDSLVPLCLGLLFFMVKVEKKKL